MPKLSDMDSADDGLLTADPVLQPGSDLTGADLRGRDLAGATLAGATLEGADLTDANLADADLTGASLRGACLHGASLEGARLLHCDLREADLSSTRARGATFGGAKLDGAALFGSDFTNASLSQASLKGSDARTTQFGGCRFVGADLQGADLSRADLTGGDLTDAKLHETILHDADLSETKLRGIRGSDRADWIGATFTTADFTGAYLARREAIDQNYLHEFRMRGTLHRILYRVWWATSDCGRSFLRWGVWTLLFALLFGGLYQFVDIDYGGNEHAISSIYFSVVTLTTLGYGDVLPASQPAQIVVIIQVVLGYVMLGGLLSIFAGKMGRRGE